MENTANDLTYLRSDWIHHHLLELSARERKLSAEIIEYLAEVDRRKIFAELGYASLFDYVTKGLLYTEGAATRRINAARLFRQIPEVKNKIVEGALTLGQLANVAAVIKKSENETHKKITIEEKKVILEKLEFKSQRESEKELAETFNLQTIEFTKVVARKNETFEVRFSLSKSEFDLIEKTKNNLSHTVPSHDVKDLLIYFCEKFQKDQDKKRDKIKTEETNLQIENEIEPLKTHSDQNEDLSQLTQAKSQQDLEIEMRVETKKKVELERDMTKEGEKKKESNSKSNSTPIAENQDCTKSNNGAGARKQLSQKIKFQLKERAGNQCEWRHPATGERCDCKSFLEIDHECPRAWGGSNETENLRVLCREHNLFEALSRNLL